MLKIKSIFIIFILTLSCTGNPSGKAKPKAVNGILDLRTWNFINDGPVNLDGQWEFYWNELLNPKAFNNDNPPVMSDYVIIPSTWSSYESIKEKEHSFGHATYRLKVLLNDFHSVKMMRIAHVLTAYKIWINGSPVYSNGTVGTTLNDSSPDSHSRMFGLSLNDNVMDIVIQVSNYYYDMAGIAQEITIGTEKQIFSLKTFKIFFDLFFFGSILIIGIYHFFLYVLRRKEISNLYFFLTCLLIALYSLVLGERLFYDLFQFIPWEVVVKLLFFSWFLAPLTFLMFLNSFYQHVVDGRIIKFFQLISFFCVVFILVTPARTYSRYSLSFQLFDLLLCLFIFYISIRVCVKKYSGSFILISGYLVLLITAFNDVLFYREIINTLYLLPFGLFIFILSHSFIVSFKFSKAFESVESLSFELNKKNKALLGFDKLKDEFLMHTSHELKTPIHGMIGIADSTMLNFKKYNAEEIKSNLSLIVSNGKRLSNLINDILDFSRLKNNDIIMQLSPVDLKASTDSVLKMSNQLIGNKKLMLKNLISSNIPLITADEARLQQILFNLVSNAIKYTQEGLISIHAKEFNEWKSAESQNSDFIQITVSDTGIGIPKEKHDVVFNSLEQTGEGIAKKYGGSGLGLYIVKRLVEHHKGKIWLESEVGEGTSFHFTIPVFHDQDKQKIIQGKNINESVQPPVSFNLQVHANNEKINSIQYFKRKILIVDDDHVNLKVLVNYLGTENYSIDVAYDGTEALKKINNERYNLVLLDVMMPGISGLEVCENIRIKFRSHELPVIMLTVKNNVSDIAAGIKAGANDYITKPFDREELISRMNTLLSLQESVSQINDLKNNIETIVSNIPEGILFLSSKLDVLYSNDKFLKLFNVQDINKKKTKELFDDKIIYKNIYNFSRNKKDRMTFEWIIDPPESPVLLNVVLKYVNENSILIAFSEIKDVLTINELQSCYYVIRGFSERETGKVLYKVRSTISSSKLKAKEKLIQSKYTSLLKHLE